MAEKLDMPLEFLADYISRLERSEIEEVLKEAVRKSMERDGWRSAHDLSSAISGVDVDSVLTVE
jgi:hypothetical protein